MSAMAFVVRKSDSLSLLIDQVHGDNSKFGVCQQMCFLLEASHKSRRKELAMEDG